MCYSKANGGKRCAGRLARDREREAKKIASGTQSVTTSQGLQEIACAHCGKTYHRGARPGHRCIKSDLLSLTSNTAIILKAIRDVGGLPLIVGGSIRDALLIGEHAPKDIDIEVYGIDIDTLAHGLSSIGQVNEVGKAFSVLKMTLGQEDFDISLPRLDSKIGDGHQGFQVIADQSLDEVAAFGRRDYTVNAMGWDPFTHELVDPYGGSYDLNAGVLRHVSKAFSEDPLRVMRGVQFAGRFGFTLAPETIEECRSLNESFHELSTDRIWMEWSKIASKASTPSKSLQALYDTGWEKHFPELSSIRNVEQGIQWHPEGSVDVHAAMSADLAAEIAVRDNLSEQDRIVLVLAAITHDFGKATHSHHEEDGRITSHGHAEAGEPFALSFLDRIGSPEIVKKQVGILVREHMAHAGTDKGNPSRKAVMRLIRRLEGGGNGPTLEQWARVVEADCGGRGSGAKPSAATKWLAVAETFGTGMKATPSILRGEHLIARGMKPGVLFKPILAAALEAQDEGLFDDEASALQWLSKEFPIYKAE